MAVSAAGPVRLSYFVRLKLRLMLNSLYGQGWRIALFIVGAVFAMSAAGGGFLLFASTGPARPGVSLVIASFSGAAIVLGWLLMPLLFFGIDETIDPARFALLPLSRWTLVRGMLAAACVSMPATATLVATLGLVAAGAWDGGPATAAVALVGAVLGLLLCVVGSRALASAFASMLRSRRVRDLAAVVLAVVASSVAPLQWAVSSMVLRSDLDQAVGIARWVAWTPFAAPYVVHLDASQGRWGQAAARLAITAGAIAVLLAWWWVTVESAMIGTTSAGRRRSKAGAAGPVAALLPKGVPATRFAAIVVRELRYWWRDPRRRASLVSLTIAGVVIPVVLRVGDQSSAPLPLAVAFTGVFTAMVLANQFGTDGTAYAMHLLVGLPGRVELQARVVALALITVPIQAATVLTVGVATGAAAQLPAAFGTVAAGFGASAGAAAIVSVFAPYAFPDSSNPFAVSGGTAGLRGMLALVGSAAALALTAPVLVMALLTGGGWGWLVLAVGLGWGLGGLLLGTYLAGDALDRRGPEVLVQITPRR